MQKPNYIKDEHLDLLNALSNCEIPLSYQQLKNCLMEECKYLTLKEANNIMKYWIKNCWKNENTKITT